MKPYATIKLILFAALLLCMTAGRPALADSTAPPAAPVRLIFIHHSTGENWLADDNGGLGTALQDNNYFVSDTNYGWGPADADAGSGTIGDHTDIGNWYSWFRSPNSPGYLSALYGEAEQHASYARLGANPGGENEIIMFKSCFPNSALQGSPGDAVPAIGDNPLKGQDSGSEYHTVANAKGIYIDLLQYFETRQDKLFIVIAAPPLTNPTWSANARALNNWLANEWLAGYAHNNVFVFDFYNVLTTNGGTKLVNDLDRSGGNHHRWWSGSVQHKTDGDNDLNPNVLEYPSGDDHPNRAGNLKATAEFAPLLNLAYNRWKNGGSPSSTTTTTPGGNGKLCAVKEVYGADSQATFWLRDYRDTVLAPTMLGRAATRLYYAASPVLVGIMQKNHCVAGWIKSMLDGFMHCRQQQDQGNVRGSWQLAQRHW